MCRRAWEPEELNENSIDVVEGVINARTELPSLGGAAISALKTRRLMRGTGPCPLYRSENSRRLS
jgi:hypothetical protein